MTERATRIAFAFLLLGAVCIAFAPIFVRLSELGPTATAFHRLFLSLPVLWLWSNIDGRRTDSGNRPAGTGDYLGLSLAGIFFACDLGVWHLSITYTSVANATLFANFAPIFVTLGGFLLFKERFTGTFLAGMGLAIAGAVVLMGESLTLSMQSLAGDALGLLTAVFYACYILTVSRLRARFPAVVIMSWSSLVAAAFLLPVTLAMGEGLLARTLYGWAVLLGLALVSHAGGQGLIAHALGRLPAAFSSVSLLLQPAVAALLAWIILDESLSPLQAVGAAVILAGIHLAHRGSR